MRIDVHNVTKRFGAFAALAGVDLEIRAGELVALLGPSGSGKTTLLRIIAGLEWPDEGEIRFDGEDALLAQRRRAQCRLRVPALRAVPPHDGVRERRLRPARAARATSAVGEDEIRTRVGKLLDLVQLGWLAERYPSQLSGGQRQRVALARALAIEPRVLLLDEPFGALDAKVRKELRRWLRELHEEIHVTSVFVTHDQEEALEVADRVVVMDRGRIEQIGTPEEVYERPATAFVHEFIGESIVLPVTVDRRRRPPRRRADRARFPGGAQRRRAPVRASLRDGGGAGRRRAVWRAASRASTASARRGGSRSRSRSQDGAVVEVDVPRSGELAPGQEVGLRPRAYRIFAAAP